MPNEIQTQLSDIKFNYKYYYNNHRYISKGIYTIFSHNLIIKFARIFHQKYNEIKSHQFCLQFPLTMKEIEEQKKAALDDFIIYNPNLLPFDTTIYLNENEIINTKFSQIKIPDELHRYECFTKSNCQTYFIYV